MEYKYYSDKLFFNLLNQYGSADKIFNIEDYKIGVEAEDNLVQAGRQSLFLESTLDRRLDRKISIQGRFRVDSRVDI